MLMSVTRTFPYTTALSHPSISPPKHRNEPQLSFTQTWWQISSPANCSGTKNCEKKIYEVKFRDGGQELVGRWGLVAPMRILNGAEL